MYCHWLQVEIEVAIDLEDTPSSAALICSNNSADNGNTLLNGRQIKLSVTAKELTQFCVSNVSCIQLSCQGNKALQKKYN